MIRLPRRRPTRRSWQLYSHPMARMPLPDFHRHVKQMPVEGAWTERYRRFAALRPRTDTTTARGNR